MLQGKSVVKEVRLLWLGFGFEAEQTVRCRVVKTNCLREISQSWVHLGGKLLGEMLMHIGELGSNGGFKLPPSGLSTQPPVLSKYACENKPTSISHGKPMPRG